MKPFESGHEDLVHDVAYDFYGRFVATCSSDQHIKVFKANKETNNWELSDSWKAHDSSIVAIDWASPEFGRIIASASYDKTVKIWEENPDQEECSGRHWNKLASLMDSHGALYDLKFAPVHLGLRLATIGNDGFLRIYDALEPSDLSSWTLTSEINILSQPPANHLQSDFCLSWCPSRFSTEKLAISVLDQAIIYQRGVDNKLHIAAKLLGHNGLIRSISWAPTIGRWYQLIATGSKDGKVRIYKITETKSDDIPTNTNTNNNINKNDSNENVIENENELIVNPNLSTRLKVELLSEHDDHKSEVWSVSWNLTGTILSSAGDDGKVRLWKSTYSNEFKCMSIITAKQ